MVDQQLFAAFLRIYTFQPATAFWRAVEVDVLQAFLPTSGRCLDLGCGDGKLSGILFQGKTDANFALVGVDRDEYETRQAAMYPLYQRIHTVPASSIPEASASFDAAVSNSVLEHISDLEPAIAEVSRLLKPRGTFIFTVPGPGFHACLRGPLNRRSSRQAYLQEIDSRLAHHRYLDLSDWANLLSKYDLEIEHSTEYLNRAEVQRWESISRFTGGILYRLAGRKLAPIAIQKQSGLRSLQNKLVLPLWLANGLAGWMLIGLKPADHPELNGCLLVVAKKKAS